MLPWRWRDFGDSAVSVDVARSNLFEFHVPGDISVDQDVG